MNEMEQMSQKRIAEFTENYLEKLFYFCLKRTGDSREAEDLASDIALNILTALKKGLVPTHFSAWIWQIARNRYSAWAAGRRRHRERAAGADIGDCELVSEDVSVEEALIRREELSLLRRELSFISSDYRDIVVAYYIEDRKIQDIAASARLSEGTVKSKLFRARKKLKEGMNMAREFGTKSFKPENVYFATSGDQPGNLPWRLLRRKLPKNILLQASNNPSTIEELSIELGTALPYMEEEVELLVQGTLLKKVDNQYVTDFFIFDRESQLSIYAAHHRASQKRSEMFFTIAAGSLPLMRKLGIVRNQADDNELLWWALTALADHCASHLKDYDIEWPSKRANGERWGIVGYEETDLPENCRMSHNGSGNDENMFWCYQFSDYDFWKRGDGTPDYTDTLTLFLADVIRNNRNKSSFSTAEQSQWRHLENRYAHSDRDGNIIPDILVIYSDDMEKLTAAWEAHPLYEKAAESLQAVFDETIAILKKSANPLLHAQLPYCASMQILDCRMVTIRDTVNSGKLIPPEDPAHSTAAMWMALKR